MAPPVASRGMRLADLVTAVPTRLIPQLNGSGEVVIAGVRQDSRRVERGDLFVCIVGATADGHEFAAAAVESGAVALVVERPLDIDVPQLVVTDTRSAVGPLLSRLLGEPSRQMVVVGITGTNGKTTTAALLAAIARSSGWRVEVIGTLSGARTTPEATDLQYLLADFVEQGVQAVVMEVSSHALELHRVDGCHFALGVFTNLGRDHLDLHGSMENYFRAKARLFSIELAASGLVNRDDVHGALLVDTAPIPMHSYSLDDIDIVEVTSEQHRFVWRGREVTVPLGGWLNVTNSVAALSAAELLGIDIDAAVHGIASVDRVRGRFEVIEAAGLRIIVDYAHTPEGLEALLDSVRRVTPEGRITIVFGCGGDRDQDKRPAMGAAAATRADRVVITSDNPRREDPQTIADQILSGIDQQRRDRVVVELDRRRAIARAIADAHPGDVIVVAGKGHETYQTIGTVDHEFDDVAVAGCLLREMAS